MKFDDGWFLLQMLCYVVLGCNLILIVVDYSFIESYVGGDIFVVVL